MKLHLLLGIISAPIEAEMILLFLSRTPPSKTTANRKITESGAVVARAPAALVA